MTGLLVRGRKAYAEGDWPHAFAQLSAADAAGLVDDPADLELLAVVACLLGEDGVAVDAWAHEHHVWLGRGEPARAARAAFWPALWLLLTGDLAGGGGWLARAQQVLEECRTDCVEQGYVLVPVAVQTMFAGDPAAAHDMFLQISHTGDRFRERELMTIGRLGRGQALIRSGRPKQGTALLDEAMVALTAGELSPLLTGIVYCAVLVECTGIFDLRRAREWTAALSRWCADQPDLVPFRGQCLVHRAEIMRARGDWPQALAEAQRACARRTDPPHQSPVAVGAAFYELGELQRLRGGFAAAERAYTEANWRGRLPQPGLALLRMSQGDVPAAFAGIRAAAEQVHDAPTRAQLLGPYVEIAIAAGDLPAAQAATEELGTVAAQFGVPYLRSAALQAAGAVALLGGGANTALASLREALTGWQDLDTPYEAAKTRVLLGLASRDLGDNDGAAMEWDAARRTFRRLGAAPDLARLERLTPDTTTKASGGLTAREVEVLALVAAGRTNREIAHELMVSDHTVRRHLQNVFAKLDVASRAAATAFAVQHHLI